MIRPSFLVLTLIVFNGCHSNGYGGLQPDNLRPNIIFILADDMGYGDIKAFNPDSKIPTPNLDKLAAQGMSFTNAHAPAAVCTPTRYSFLTGRYSWRSKMKRGVSWIWDEPLLDKNQFTIATMLKETGYRTACIGKWHLGWDWPTKDGELAKLSNGKNVDYSKPIKNGPTTLGFDYYFGSDVPSFPPHAFIENNRVVQEPTDWWESGKAGAAGAMVPGWRYEDLLPTLSKKSIQYVIESSVSNNKEPFFLFYSLSAPHTPIAPNANFIGKSNAGRYGDFVVEIDHYIGQLMSTLDSLGLTDNTLVIFTSDNGPTNMDGQNYVGKVGSILQYGHNSSGVFRGLKSGSWEGGHREPFIARWPEVIPSQTINNELISLVDMAATFSELLTYSLADSIAVDSKSILPLFKNEKRRVRKDIIVQSGNGVLSLIENNWKLIMSSGGGGLWSGDGEMASFESITASWQNVQLFDLAVDPDEQNNLADVMHEKVKAMVSVLTTYIRNGRSTPGSTLENDGEKIWESIRWIESVD